jgi:hypothetical protein
VKKNQNNFHKKITPKTGCGLPGYLRCMNQIIAQIHAFFKSISMFLIMTTGKQSTMRYRILHACLSSRAKHYRSINELIEKMAEHDLLAEKRWIEKDYEAQRIRSAYTGSYAWGALLFFAESPASGTLTVRRKLSLLCWCCAMERGRFTNKYAQRDSRIIRWVRWVGVERAECLLVTPPSPVHTRLKSVINYLCRNRI